MDVRDWSSEPAGDAIEDEIDEMLYTERSAYVRGKRILRRQYSRNMTAAFWALEEFARDYAVGTLRIQLTNIQDPSFFGEYNSAPVPGWQCEMSQDSYVSPAIPSLGIAERHREKWECGGRAAEPALAICRALLHRSSEGGSIL